MEVLLTHPEVKERIYPHLVIEAFNLDRETILGDDV